MSVIELIKNNPDYSNFTKTELENLLLDCKSELEVQSSVNVNKKVLINAGYGVQTVPSFRFKKHYNAEAITSSGQLCVRGVGNYIENKLKGKEYQISNQYFDTDSLFINYINKYDVLNDMNEREGYEKVIGTIMDWNKEHVQPIIDEYFDGLAVAFNAMSNKIEMDFELIADKSTFFAPKKYIMRKIWEEGKYLNPDKNTFKLRGIEIVRTTTPQFFRDKLKEAVKIIYNQSNEELLKFIDQTKKEYLKLDFIDMANPTGVNGMDKYNLNSKRIPIHVYGSLIYNLYIENKKLSDRYQLITDKNKIKISYIKQPNCMGSHVISVPNNIFPDELKDKIELDYDRMFDKNFMNPIKRFLEVVNWDDVRQYDLDDAF